MQILIQQTMKVQKSDLEETQDKGEEPARRKHRRKMLRCQRNVHDVNSSLCEENYTPLEAVDKLKIIKSEIKSSFKTKNHPALVDKTPAT